MKEEIIITIARKIKAERLKRSLTLNDISKKSGLSRGLLSKVENSRTIPSMPVFFSILKAMEISPNIFFENIEYQSEGVADLVRPIDHKPMEKEKRPGFEYSFIMSHQIQDIYIEVVLLKLRPQTKAIATATDGFELKYILDGNLTYRIDDKTFELAPGDTLFFDGSKAHRPENLSKGDVLMLVIYFMVPKI